MKNRFWLSAVIGWIWVQSSETWRYFAYVQPEVRKYFSSSDPGIFEYADNIPIWVIWGTLLTALTLWLQRLIVEQRGDGFISAVIAAGFVWLSFFVLFWCGLANMGLASWKFVPIPLTLSLIELAILTLIVNYLSPKNGAALNATPVLNPNIEAGR